MENRIQITTNFYLDEFLDPKSYFKAINNGFNLMDENIFLLAQKLRDFYEKPININTWWSLFEQQKGKMTIDDVILYLENQNKHGKCHIWSGYRSKECRIGAKNSAHRYGQGVDPKGDEKRFFKIIRDNRAEFYNLGLRRLEDISITKGWIHMDTLERNTRPNSIRVVDLKTVTQTIWI